MTVASPTSCPWAPDCRLDPKLPYRCEWGGPLASGPHWAHRGADRGGQGQSREEHRLTPPPRLPLRHRRRRAVLTCLRRSRPVSRTCSPRGWGRGRGSRAGYTRNPTGQLLCPPPPPAPMVDASACLLTKIQGRGRRRLPRKARPSHPAILSPGGPAGEAAGRSWPGSGSGSLRPLPVGTPQCSADSGLPHCAEVTRRVRGGDSGTRRRGGPERPGCGSLLGAVRRALSPEHRRRPWPRCWSPIPGQPRARRPPRWRRQAGRSRRMLAPR